MGNDDVNIYLEIFQYQLSKILHDSIYHIDHLNKFISDLIIDN